MTLREFAAQLGISYETAKKRRQRGQIVANGDNWTEIVPENRDIGDKVGDTGTGNGDIAVEFRDKVGDIPAQTAYDYSEAFEHLDRIDLLEAQNSDLQTRIADLEAKNAALLAELTELRSHVCAVTSAPDSDEPPLSEPDLAEMRIFTHGEFLTLCCEYLKRVTGEAVHRSAVEIGLKQAKIRPGADGCYTPRHFERFLTLVQI